MEIVTRELLEVEVVAEQLAFPEGPVAMADGSVLFVEVRGGRLSRAFPDGRVETVAELGGGPNGAAIGPDGAVYVCNAGGINAGPAAGSIQRVDLTDGTFTTLYSEIDGKPLNAPNDLVFDRTGGFWFTDHVPGRVLYAAADGSGGHVLERTAPFANGIGLSPDGTVLYWAQTHTRQVMRRRLTAPGVAVPSPGYGVHALVFRKAIDPWALLAGLPGGAELDSMAIDSSGAVCVGTLVESGITVISADGSHVERWTLPTELDDLIVTNICFGGADLRTAYLTCSQHGRLVRCRWPRPGLRLAFQELPAT